MDHLSIAGATLASLLQSTFTNQRPCDGLLFGNVSTVTSTQARDTSDALMVQETAAHIASSCTCISSHSFYTNAGDIAGDKLQTLMSSAGVNSSSSFSSNSGHDKQLLGWFSYRPTSPAVPSMMEAAVCQKLLAWIVDCNAAHSTAASGAAPSHSTAVQQQQQRQELPQHPLIFGLITSQPDHNGATISLQYRFFAYHPNSSWQSKLQHSSTNSSGGSSSQRSRQAAVQQHPNFQPLDVGVSNLGQLGRAPGLTAAAGASVGHSSSVVRSSSSSSSSPAPPNSSNNSGNGSSRQGTSVLSTLATTLEPSGVDKLSQSLGSSQVRELLTAAGLVDVPGSQLSVIQGLYDSLLEELQVAAAVVSEKQAQLQDLQHENSALRQQVADRLCVI